MDKKNHFKHPLHVASDTRLSVRVADAITRFAGSMMFVYLHVLGFAVWMTFFEKNPWSTLTLVVSLEAIFLSTFVMIGQNRQSEKDHAMAEFDYKHNSESLALLRALHLDAHGADCTKCLLDMVRDDEEILTPHV